MLVPKLIERPKVITEVHDGHGHFGIESTFKRDRTSYYWPKMYQELKEAIKFCVNCQVCDRTLPKSLSLWPIYTLYLFQRFGLDYVGPLLESTLGNKYILVITEYYTRWPIAAAEASADAETTARVLYKEVFCAFGPLQEF